MQCVSWCSPAHRERRHTRGWDSQDKVCHTLANASLVEVVESLETT